MSSKEQNSEIEDEEEDIDESPFDDDMDNDKFFDDSALMAKDRHEYVIREEKWRKRRKRKTEDSSTVEGVLDLPTAKKVLKLINQGYIKGLGGVISTGKEANVYYASSGSKEKEIGLSELAIKIYRTRTLDWRKIRNYIAGDIRFQKKTGRKSHQIIEIWALKEYKNLSRAYENGIRVPRPVVVKRNVLVMEFIGKDGIPAPLLRLVPNILDPVFLYKDLVKQIDLLWNKALLVHGDLSPYNILFNNDKTIIIDIGQGVLRNHHLAKPFLYRDIQNMVLYFETLDNVDCASTEDLYEQITGEKPNPAFESLKFV